MKPFEKLSNDRQTCILYIMIITKEYMTGRPPFDGDKRAGWTGG